METSGLNWRNVQSEVIRRRLKSLTGYNAMDPELFLLFFTIMLAVVVLRAYLAKKDKLPFFKSGKTHTENLQEKARLAERSRLGGQAGRSGQNANQETAAQKADRRSGRSADSSKSSLSLKGKQSGAGPGKSGKPETNSNKKDLIRTITAVGTYAKKNRFYLFFPGTFMLDEQIEVLTAILITRSMIVGINCMGYGGQIEAGKGYDDWVQTMNGKRTRFMSPVKKNEARKAHLQEALQRVGLDMYPCEMISVFTSPTVRVQGGAEHLCFTENEMLSWLRDRAHMLEEQIDVKAAAAAFEPLIYREEQEEKK